MKVLIPMAGEGSRFSKMGYQYPKPLIDVLGKPMIQRVIENLNFGDEYIFLVREKHLKDYPNLESNLKMATKGKYKIILVDSLTEGAACTALLAENLINTDEDLLIANSDQIIKYELDNFLNLKNLTNVDSIVFTFNSTHPKWSFVKMKNNFVCEVAEKNPISNIATCGIYWYRRGSDFVKYAKQMIFENCKVNNEFYIAPVYNWLIKDNKTLIPFFVTKMHGIGTPEDLEIFLNEQSNMF